MQQDTERIPQLPADKTTHVIIGSESRTDEITLSFHVEGMELQGLPASY